jgi:ankyrin repeat protein
VHFLHQRFFKLFIMDTTIPTLISAARTGDTAFLRSIIEDGANVNVNDDKGYTPLIIACYNRQADAAKMLIEAGAAVNAADFGGNTSLMGVCFKGYHEIAQLLIEKGAALMFATMFGRNELVRLLLDAGADAAITDHRGLTAYDLAIQQGNKEAETMLLNPKTL